MSDEWKTCEECKTCVTYDGLDWASRIAYGHSWGCSKTLGGVILLVTNLKKRTEPLLAEKDAKIAELQREKIPFQLTPEQRGWLKAMSTTRGAYGGVTLSEDLSLPILRDLALRLLAAEQPTTIKPKTAAELAAEYMSLVLDSKTFPAGSEEDEEQSNKRGQLEKQWLQAREAEKAGKQ